MPTMAQSGLVFDLQQLLGLTLPEPLALLLFNAPAFPTLLTPFSDYVATPLPGAAAIELVPANWSDESVEGVADFRYPVIPFLFGSTVAGDVLIGYVVYAVVSETVVWFHEFEIPQTIPPSGGRMFLNLEIRGVERSV